MPAEKTDKKPAQKWSVLATNLNYILQSGKNLHFKIDVSKELGLSKSKKTMIIASSRGNKLLTLDDGTEIFVGINIYKYAEPKE